MDNYYRLLGLPPDATTDEIEKRCLELGGQVRPDIHSDDNQVQQRFDEIERAFVTLTNPTSRAAYDESLRGNSSFKLSYRDRSVYDVIHRWLRYSGKRYAFVFSLLGGLYTVGYFLLISPDWTMPSLFPQPNIVAKCTTNGFGRVSCTFTNFGKAKGGRCLTIELRKSSTEQSISSEVICSGLIEPSDVRDRTIDVTFTYFGPPHFGEPKKPYLFCSNGAIGESWSGDCIMTMKYLETTK